jgi:hypothetical protein
VSRENATTNEVPTLSKDPWAGPTGSVCVLKDKNVPRLALSKAEAALSLGVSVDYLEEHVLPELRVVRRGRRRLIAVAELERWLMVSASLAVER